MPSNRETIGHVDCGECGEKVAVKLRKDGTSDYFCKCGDVHLFTISRTAKIVAAHAEPTLEPETETDDRPDPEQPAERNDFEFWNFGS